jgi:DNA-binding NarL/FixJ family response regulator
MTRNEASEHLLMPSRIIVADAQHLFRVALGNLLEEHSGWEVVAEAADGREALMYCRRFRPDLVIMDVRMPEVDGLVVTRAIKREFPCTVVLMLCGYGDADLLEETLQAGASGFILKTSTPRQITDAVRQALEGATPLDQDLATGLLLRLISGARKDSTSGSDPRGPSSVTLTQREVQVLRLIAQGRTNRQIARNLFVSVSTTKKHVQRIFSKLEVSDRTQAAVKANVLGLLDDAEAKGGKWSQNPYRNDHSTHK